MFLLEDAFQKITNEETAKVWSKYVPEKGNVLFVGAPEYEREHAALASSEVNVDSVNISAIVTLDLKKHMNHVIRSIGANSYTKTRFFPVNVLYLKTKNNNRKYDFIVLPEVLDDSYTNKHNIEEVIKALFDLSKHHSYWGASWWVAPGEHSEKYKSVSVYWPEEIKKVGQEKAWDVNYQKYEHFGDSKGLHIFELNKEIK